MSPVRPNSTGAMIAARIRQLRHEMKQTQEDFADLIGVPRSHVADLENGRVEPSLQAIAGILVYDLRVAGVRVPRVDPDWLLLGPSFAESMFTKRPKGFWKNTTPSQRQDMADATGAGAGGFSD